MYACGGLTVGEPEQLAESPYPPVASRGLPGDVTVGATVAYWQGWLNPDRNLFSFYQGGSGLRWTPGDYPCNPFIVAFLPGPNRSLPKEYR